MVTIEKVSFLGVAPVPKAGVDIGVTPFEKLKETDRGKYLQHWESG